MGLPCGTRSLYTVLCRTGDKHLYYPAPRGSHWPLPHPRRHTGVFPPPEKEAGARGLKSCHSVLRSCSQFPFSFKLYTFSLFFCLYALRSRLTSLFTFSFKLLSFYFYLLSFPSHLTSHLSFYFLLYTFSFLLIYFNFSLRLSYG